MFRSNVRFTNTRFRAEFNFLNANYACLQLKTLILIMEVLNMAPSNLGGFVLRIGNGG